jgi:hypothetical protein
MSQIAASILFTLYELIIESHNSGETIQFQLTLKQQNFHHYRKTQV